MRSAPAPQASVLTALSFAVVRLGGDRGYPQRPWTAVVLPDGRPGFVAAELVRSPIDYRAYFVRAHGEWQMTMFIAGDQALSAGTTMSNFGRDDVREMPGHFFAGALRLDYQTAVRANPTKQNCSICPRYWYVDAIFPCARCGAAFAFTASEQRVWYEDYGFWIDSRPKHCLACRQQIRQLKAARQDYDQNVARVLEHGDLDSKKRLAGVIDQLYELGGELPARINETRRRLANEIAKAPRDA